MREFEGFLKLVSSKNTKTNYKMYMNDLFTFKNVETLDDFRILQLEDIVDWLDYLRTERKNSDNSINTKFQCLSSFYEFLISDKKNNITQNFAVPVIKKLNPQVSPKRRTFLTLSESKKFLNECKNKRETAISMIFLNTGLRVSELISLDITKYYKYETEEGKKAGYIDFIRKGNKERRVFLNSEVVKSLDDYIENERKTSVYNNIFISNGGKPMSVQSIDRTLNKLADRAQINKRISAHSLRRSAATGLHVQGFDMLDIKEVLGHENLATTQLYIQDLTATTEKTMMNYVITN